MKQALLALGLVWVGAGMHTLSAQKLVAATYQVTVVTKTGERIKGILDEVTATDVYCGSGLTYDPAVTDQVVPLETIRKVRLRRTNKKRAVQAGAIVGAIAVGFLGVEGLKKNPASNPITYGATVVLASVGGAAAGLVVGSAVGSLSHRTIRPRDGENSLTNFRRQLEPFSMRYQNDVFNRIHQ